MSVKGPGKHGRKFSELDIIAMRLLRKNGTREGTIALLYDCAESTVCAIVTGKSYKDCGGPVHQIYQTYIGDRR